MNKIAKNLYEILDIPLQATNEEIKARYKKLVMLYHPDINKSPEALIKFKLITNAYEILSDREKRRNYDELFKILKSDIKKQQSSFWTEQEKTKAPSKNSIIQEVKILQKEIESGAKRTVNILNRKKCPYCLGKKIISGTKCPYCMGKGEKRDLKKVEICIPENTKDGDYIYVAEINEGEINQKSLFVKILIDSKEIVIEGNNAYVQIEVPLYDAILGKESEIVLDPFGVVNFSIPPLSKPNQKIPLEIKQVIQPEKIINYFVEIKIIFPDTITNEEKSLYDKIKKLNNKKKLKNGNMFG